LWLTTQLVLPKIQFVISPKNFFFGANLLIGERFRELLFFKISPKSLSLYQKMFRGAKIW
jgi:hypothetical protein